MPLMQGRSPGAAAARSPSGSFGTPRSPSASRLQTAVSGAPSSPAASQASMSAAAFAAELAPAALQTAQVCAFSKDRDLFVTLTRLATTYI